MSGHEPALPSAATPYPAGHLESAASQSEFIEPEFQEIRPRQLRDYLRVVYKHRWPAAACFGGSVALTIIITLLTTRQYTAAMRIQVARDLPIKLQLKDNVLNLDETDRILNGASSFQSTQVQALSSRDLAERVLRSLHLSNPAFPKPGVDGTMLAALAAGLPDVLRPRGFEAVGNAAATDGATNPVAVDAGLLDQYMGYLDVQDVRGTDLIEIRFTTPNPALSALLAAAHTKAYLDDNLRTQLATDSAAMEFLESQLQQALGRVEKAETALNEFASKHPNVAVNQEHELIGKQIAELSTLVTAAEAERVSKQSRYEFLAKAKKEPLAYLFDDSEPIRKLRLALMDVEVQRAALKTRLGPNHSQMAELRRQGAEINSQLQTEIEQEIGAARANYSVAKAHEDELRQRLAQLERTAIELRDLGGQYALLKAELEGARALHDSLAKQKTETGVHSALNTSKVRVIERPEVPQRPSKPRKTVNLAMGLLAGIMCAGAAIALREGLDASVKSSDEVEGLLQLPTLAIIPTFEPARSTGLRAFASARGARAVARGMKRIHTSGPADKRLVVVNEPRSAVAEAFRSLRTAVLFSAGANPPRVMLVTSAADGEGKTVTALNLSATLADAGWRVLLLDADLRDPKGHEALQVENRCGLSTVLAGQADLDSAIQELAAPRLSFLPAGPTPAQPAELVGSGRMQAMMQHLRKRYDFIVVDSPPVLAVTDAVVLARVVDGVVLVVKGHDAPRELIRRARCQLQQAGARFLGVVVNNVDLHWGDLDVYRRYRGYRRQPAEQQLGA
ncbi:MAG TPA: polysaccharide biosynthesis tyrosine autokinase [Candidatus Margulisiibacteriota bacterium]|nr:polysaccharide biosynthesis tyrosine autokinase [Candidatus Margulisiibacteriota bacterium]